MTAVRVGEGEALTAQLPAAGQTVPGGSQVLLYYGQAAETEYVKVPDFSGMTRQQASDAAGLLGLYILVSGNPSVEPKVVVIGQNVPVGTEVPRGSTITLNFADISIRD